MLIKTISLSVVCLLAFCWAAQAQLSGGLVTLPSGDNTKALGSPPANITASGSWTSACVPASEWRAFSIFVAMQKVATLSGQRYLDKNCAVAVGTALPATPLILTQGGNCPGTSFCGSIAENDGVPFISENFTITDTSGTQNSTVNIVLVQGAK